MARPKGISKADISFAMNGEQGVSEHFAEQEQISQMAMAEAYSQPAEKFVIFKLVNNKRNGGTYIHGVDDVVNPATGKVERIRLLSGISTIWLSEQVKQGVTKEYAEQNQRSLVFPRGTKILQISEADSAAIEFARMCRHNVKSKNYKTGSKFEFFEYDPAAQQRAALEREEFEIEMAIEAKQQPVEYMRKHAVYLGIRMFDEFGIPKTDEGVRREYVVAAKRNPKLFKETLQSRSVELNFKITRAVNEGKIDLGAVHGAAVWSATQAQICRIPSGQQPIQYLLELAMTNTDEGRTFAKDLEIYTAQ